MFGRRRGTPVPCRRPAMLRRRGMHGSTGSRTSLCLPTPPARAWPRHPRLAGRCRAPRRARTRRPRRRREDRPRAPFHRSAGDDRRSAGLSRPRGGAMGRCARATEGVCGRVNWRWTYAPPFDLAELADRIYRTNLTPDAPTQPGEPKIVHQGQFAAI